MKLKSFRVLYVSLILVTLSFWYFMKLFYFFLIGFCPFVLFSILLPKTSYHSVVSSLNYILNSMPIELHNRSYFRREY